MFSKDSSELDELVRECEKSFKAQKSKINYKK